MKLLIGFDNKIYPGVNEFKSIGTCKFINYNQQSILKYIASCDIFIPHLREPIDNKILKYAKKLKIIATPSTGKDHIDENELNKRNIKLITLFEDRKFLDKISSTAEMNWLLILSCIRNFRFLIDRIQKEKKWTNSDIRGNELQGKTIGVIGFGRLGKKIAKYAETFGMNVLVYDIKKIKHKKKYSFVTLNKLLESSDIISMNVKLNPSSRQMISFEQVNKMKKGVIFVNTARGDTVSSRALIKGLNSGKIGSIGIDVCNNEYSSSYLPNDPLITKSFTDKRIIVTPHAGGATHDAHNQVFKKLSDLIKINISNNKI